MSNQGSIQRFFRVYMPNYSADDMKLPLGVDKVSGMPLPRKVTVESVSSGNIWRMEMTSNGGSDTVFLRDGWKKIVKDENLNRPTFLVFEFDGSSVFHFSVYDHSTMCKRMRSPKKKEVTEEESEEADDEESTKVIYVSESEEVTEEETEEAEEDDDVGENTKVVDESESEEADEDDDEESTKVVDESERGGTSRRNRYLKKTDSDQFREYIDDKLNPSFLVHNEKNRTRIPAALIKDYNMKFPKLVSVCDKIGTLQKKISVWKNGPVFLNGVDSFFRRNDMKPSDQMVFELKMVNGHQGLVSEIKVHIVKG